MKKVNRIISILIFLLFLPLIFSSCSGSYDDMLHDFNDSFFSAEFHEKSIYDDDFVAEEMLELKYDFYEGFESSLSAPAGAVKYSWTIPKENTMPVEYSQVCTEQTYTFMPGKDYEAGSETKLILTVTDENGTEYIDSTIIKINRELPV